MIQSVYDSLLILYSSLGFINVMIRYVNKSILISCYDTITLLMVTTLTISAKINLFFMIEWATKFFLNYLVFILFMVSMLSPCNTYYLFYGINNQQKFLYWGNYITSTINISILWYETILDLRLKAYLRPYDMQA